MIRMALPPNKFRDGTRSSCRRLCLLGAADDVHSTMKHPTCENKHAFAAPILQATDLIWTS